MEWIRVKQLLATCFTFFILITQSIGLAYEIVRYEDLDLSLLYLCKKTITDTHTREVYFDFERNQFVKTWTAQNSLSKNFLNASKCGFYERLSPLKALIFDQNNDCRGYITWICQRSGDLLGEYKLKTELAHFGFQRLKSIEVQNLHFRRFYQDLLETCEATGLIYLDFVPENILLDNGRYLLADLEDVYTLKELTTIYDSNVQHFDFIMNTLPGEYAAFIQKKIEPQN